MTAIFSLVLLLAILCVPPCLAQDPQQLFGGDKSAASAPAAPAAKATPAGKKATPASSVPAKIASPTKVSAPVAAKSPPSGGAKAPGHTTKAAAPAKRYSNHVTNLGPSEHKGARPSGPPPASRAQVQGYCNKLWNKVQNNWEFATGKNHVILGVDVDSGGNVQGTQVSSHPKNADAEAKAQQALTKSEPLEALPTGLPYAHLTIIFDSTADPHGDTSSSGSIRLEYNPGAAPSASHSSAPASAPSTATGTSDSSDSAMPAQ